MSDLSPDLTFLNNYYQYIVTNFSVEPNHATVLARMMLAKIKYGVTYPDIYERDLQHISQTIGSNSVSSLAASQSGLSVAGNQTVGGGSGAFQA